MRLLYHRFLLCAALLVLFAIAGRAEPPVLSDTYLLPGDAEISAAAGQQQQPEVAPGDGQFLAVWVDDRSALREIPNFGSGPYFETDLGTMWDIYAARLDAAGNLIDTTPIVVNQDPFNQNFPCVAWNGSHWLVVWSGQAVGDAFGNRVVNIYGARVAPDGSVLDQTPILIDSTDPMDDLYWPAVGSDGENWLVVWRDLDAGTGNWVLDGSRVGPDGAVLDPGGAPIRHPASNSSPTDPEVGFLDGSYFVVWTESAGHVRGQLLDTALAPLGADFRINPTRPGGSPDLANDGSRYFVVWADGSVPGYDVVRGARVKADGTLLDPDSIAVTPLSGFGCYAPATTWDGGAFVVTYERGLTVPVHLRAARVSAGGEVLANEIPIATVGDHADYSELAGLPGGGALVLWEDDRDDDGDVYGAVLATDGTPLTELAVALGAPRQTRGDVAVIGDGHMIAYLSETAATSRVLVHRLDAGGLPLPGEPIEVASGGAELCRPAIASTGATAMVVWEKSDENQIYGARLEADGTLLDVVPLEIVPGNTPDVAAVGNRFLVISSHEPFNHIRYPTVARVSAATGIVLDGPFTVGGSYAVEPHVVGMTDHWLAVWERNPTHDNPTPYGVAAFIDYAGNADSDFYISSGTQPLPHAAAAPDTGLFLFPEGGGSGLDLYALRVLDGGSILDPVDLTVAAAGEDQRAPTGGWDGEVFLSAWVDNRADDGPGAQTVGDLYAARVTTDGTVLDPGGFAVVAETHPETHPFTGGAGGMGILGGSLLRNEAPFGTYRVGYRHTNPDITAADDTPAAPARALDIHPNPFNPQTVVSFTLSRDADVELAIYDTGGRRLRTLFEGGLAGGRHSLSWDGRDDAGQELSSGLYLLRLAGDGPPRSARCTLLR